MEIGERKRKALVPWPIGQVEKLYSNLQLSNLLSGYLTPLSLVLHSSPLSYGLRDTKEILLWNIQSCSLKQEKYGSSWGIT
jgi:hypothetical protein